MVRIAITEAGSSWRDDVVDKTTEQTLSAKTLTSAVLNTGITGSAIISDFAGASSTTLSSSLSIKAYVDAQTSDDARAQIIYTLLMLERKLEQMLESLPSLLMRMTLSLIVVRGHHLNRV